jgi:hypothetical protein
MVRSFATFGVQVQADRARVQALLSEFSAAIGSHAWQSRRHSSERENRFLSLNMETFCRSGSILATNPPLSPYTPKNPQSGGNNTSTRPTKTCATTSIADGVGVKMEGTEVNVETVTAGQAYWIIERLLADRRISQQDVQRYVADMGREIRDLEQRLASLREAAGDRPTTSPTPRNGTAGDARTRRPGRPEKGSGHPRGIAGTLAVLLRSIPAAEHAAIAAIRADQGIKAAISAARAAVKKG